MVLQPDDPTDEDRLEAEDEDYDTPFSRPTDADDDVDIADERASIHRRPLLDDTHPTTDTNIEEEEWYDEGVSGAAEAAEPNAHDTVIDYDDPDEVDNEDEWNRAA